MRKNERRISQMQPVIEEAITTEKTQTELPIIQLDKLTETGLVKIKKMKTTYPNLSREKLVAMTEKEVEDISQRNIAISLNLRERLKNAMERCDDNLEDSASWCIKRLQAKRAQRDGKITGR